MRFGGGTAHRTPQFEARMQIFSSGFLILKVYRAVYFNCRSFLWSRVSRRVGPETLRQNCVKIVEDPEVTTYFNLKLSILQSDEYAEINISHEVTLIGRQYTNNIIERVSSHSTWAALEGDTLSGDDADSGFLPFLRVSLSDFHQSNATDHHYLPALSGFRKVQRSNRPNYCQLGHSEKVKKAATL